MTPPPAESSAPGPRVGVSACLLGEAVRYDGGHKEHPVLVAGLGSGLTLVPVCPEVELGLGTPREPIQLELEGEAILLRAPGSGADHTQAMARFAAGRLEELFAEGLDGYVFKSRSPSCGLAVDLHAAGELRPAAARGRFADALARARPELPLCEESDLDDPSRRGEFLRRVLAHARRREASGSS